MTAMTYDDYMSQVHRTQQANPEHRYGQVLFNVLWIKRPELAGMVRGSIRDPFYKTSGLEPFLAWVQENW